MELTDGVGADAVLECVGTDDVDAAGVRDRAPGLDGRLRRRAARRRAAGAPDVPEERRPGRRDGAGARATCPSCSSWCTSRHDRPRSGLRPARCRSTRSPRATARWTSAGRSRSCWSREPERSHMNELVLGPLVRYVDETSATHLGGDRATPPASRCGPGSGPARPPPSRCTATTTRWWSSTGLEPGTHHAVRRGDRRRAGLAAGRAERDFPPSRDRHPRAGQAAADGLRLLPHQRRRTTQAGNRSHGVDALRSLRAADGRPPTPRRGRALARPRALPRRPGVRRRDHRGDAGVHRRRGATSTSRRARSSRTTRSTPTSTGWPGPTRRTAGCSRRCRAR